MMQNDGVIQNRRSIEVLDELLVLTADGVEGYRHAAGAVTDPAIRSTLERAAADREQVAAVLTNTLVSLGHKPSHHGSLRGAVHRRWLDLLPTLHRASAGTILHECERGEQATIAGFSHALGCGLPDPVHQVVQTQLGKILTASARLRESLLES